MSSCPTTCIKGRSQTRPHTHLTHNSLNKCFGFGYVAPPPTIGVDVQQLRAFAEEAEDRMKLDTAAKYYLVCCCC
jgi:hypothetical protein